MENQFFCDSGTQFILSSTGAPIPPIGECAAGQFCQEGTCYASPPGMTSAIGTSEWTPKPVDITTTVHTVFTTPSGDVFGVGEHGIYLHAPPGGGTVTDETFIRRTRCGACGARARPIYGPSAPAASCCTGRRVAGRSTPRCRRRRGCRASGARRTASCGGGAQGRRPGGARAPHRRQLARRHQHHGAGRAQRHLGQLAQRRVGGRRRLRDLRFDGTSWRSGPTPPAGASGDLLAVGGSGQGDIYFVGRGGALAHLGSDGQIAMQTAPATSDLFAIWASGPGDVYAVATTASSCTRRATATGRCRSRARASRCSP